MSQCITKASWCSSSTAQRMFTAQRSIGIDVSEKGENTFQQLYIYDLIDLIYIKSIKSSTKTVSTVTTTAVNCIFQKKREQSQPELRYILNQSNRQQKRSLLLQPQTVKPFSFFFFSQKKRENTFQPHNRDIY